MFDAVGIFHQSWIQTPIFFLCLVLKRHTVLMIDRIVSRDDVLPVLFDYTPRAFVPVKWTVFARLILQLFDFLLCLHEYLLHSLSAALILWLCIPNLCIQRLGLAHRAAIVACEPVLLLLEEKQVLLGLLAHHLMVQHHVIKFYSMRTHSLSLSNE